MLKSLLLLSVAFYAVYADERIISTDKVATMSSTQSHYIAQFGNDGTVNQFDNTCAQTKVGKNQWWKVDLVNRFRLTRVVLYTSAKWTKPMANLRIESSTNNKRWEACNVFQGKTRKMQPIHLLCAANHMRYVRVYQPGVGQITLCGMLVYGERDDEVDDYKEIAATDPSWGSPAKGNHVAAMANNWGSNQCYISKASAVGLFWEVDLTFPYHLNRVAIYRGGNAGGTVKILARYRKGPWRVCNARVSLNQQIVIASCTGAATKVKLVTTSKFQLNLCQVRVYAVRFYPKNEPVQGDYIISVDKPTKQSTTFKGYVSQLGADGLMTTNGNTCSATKNLAHQWWSVDLLHHYEVDAVAIYSSAVYGSSLGPFKVQYSQTGGKYWQTCATYNKKSYDNNVISLACSRSYVNAIRIVQARKSPLIICEVIVYGVRDQKVDDYKEIAQYRPSISLPVPVKGHPAHLANDYIFDEHCFWASKGQVGAFWQVELEHLSNVDRIAFMFPSNLKESIHIKMEVRDGPDGNWIHCGSFHSPVRSSAVVVKLCRAFGTQVRISTLNDARLGLCEVDVWGLRWFNKWQWTHPESK